MPNIPIAVACFDESGHFSDTKFVAVAGCVGLPSAMDVVTDKWTDRLGIEKIPATSMKDAMHKEGHYKGWDDGRRDALLRDLAIMVREAPIYRVAASLASERFHALPRAQQKALMNDPHYAAVEACVRGALSRFQISLHLCFDLSVAYSEKCIKLFHKLRKKHADVRERCLGISFTDDQSHPGIQIADMISYCVRADETRNLVPPPPIVEEIINLLQSEDRHEGLALYRIGQELGDATISLPAPIEQSL